VLGGTLLTGGAGSVVATGIGALFLTQLEAVILESNLFNGQYEQAVRYTIQGTIIALGMALRNVPWGEMRRRAPALRARPAAALTSSGPVPTELPEGSDR